MSTSTYTLQLKYGPYSTDKTSFILVHCTLAVTPGLYRYIEMVLYGKWEPALWQLIYNVIIFDIVSILIMDFM